MGKSTTPGANNNCRTTGHYVYCLQSQSRPRCTYIGCGAAVWRLSASARRPLSAGTAHRYTVNPLRRLRQHNGVIRGGAAFTSNADRRPWSMACYVSGFKTRRAALRFEWAWQNPTRSRAARYTATASSNGLSAWRRTRAQPGMPSRAKTLRALLDARNAYACRRWGRPHLLRVHAVPNAHARYSLCPRTLRWQRVNGTATRRCARARDSNTPVHASPHVPAAATSSLCAR